MHGPRWHGLSGAFRLAKRVVAIVFAASFVSVAAPLRSSAQVEVHYGEGQYGAYRRQLADFAVRSAELVDEINQVSVVPKYCSAAERDADGKKLAALRQKLADLNRDWTRFKQGVMTVVENQGVMRQFVGMDEYPNDPNFWTNPDKEVIGHPRDDLNAKQRMWDASKVVDCYAPKTSTAPQPPIEPPPPKKDPLAGLTRPNLTLQTLPPPPKPFCSDEERWAWIRDVIKPLMDQNIDASSTLRNYGNEVWDRLSAARAARPADQDAINKLQSELDWELAEHKKWDDVYLQIIRLLKSATVIDCTEHFTTPQPVPPVDTTHPQTRERPGTGTSPVDTTHPHTQEKPGTGAPNGTEPRVGALPGGRLPGGEWRIGGGFDENWYHDFAQTAGDQQGITGFTGKQTAPGWGVDVGLRYGAWLFRVCRHVNTLHLQEYYLNPGLPYQRVDGDLAGTFYDFNLERRLGRVWKTYIGVFGGVTYAYDVLDLRTLLPSGALIDQPSRTLETWKTNFGLALERPIVSDIGVRLSSTYTTAGKSGDADANLRFSAGLTYRLPLNFRH